MEMTLTEREKIAKMKQERKLEVYKKEKDKKATNISEH
jgi:hypothetical protein